MRLKVLTAAGILSLAVVFSACGGGNDQSGTPPSESPAPTSAATEAPLATATPEPEPVSENPFLLSPEEQVIFDEYLANKDINIFKGVSPISVAKIYIECGITGNWEAEYGMFAPDTVEMTKEEWDALNAENLASFDLKTRRSAADDMFSLLSEGQLSDNGDGTGVITFKTYIGKIESRMYMVKYSDDIWLVRFDPFSE